MVLFLCGAWAYTSWYWYTCVIRELCASPAVSQNTSSSLPDTPPSQVSQTETLQEEDKEEEQNETEEQEEIFEYSGSGETAPALDVDDVVSVSNFWQRQEAPSQKQESETASWEIVENLETVTTSSQENENQQEESPQETGDLQTQEDLTLCSGFTWPLALWRENKQSEVRVFENFLIQQWLLLQSDGIFGDDDDAAVKEFQELYRGDILTPWDINSPTGYVGRTTIQKAQEIACK